MDSCNSGSIQSSSCGDEEYDSRAESNISAFFNNNNPSQSHPPPPPPPPPPRSHLNPQHPSPPPQHHHHHMFDPLSNYLDSIQKSPTHPNQNPFLNLDMVWSKPTRSEPNPVDLGGLMSPSSSSQQNQAFLFSQLAGQTRNVASVSTTHHYSLPPPESASRDQSLGNNNSSNNNTNTNTNMVRNPKKRSRASRRAPTTVLTTDTTNFRAMVQKFTGISTPPFTSSPFPRTRLDLFGSAAIRSASSTHLDPPLPPYLLRPFAQKLQPPQSHSFSLSPSSFPPSSSMVENLASNNSNNNNPSTNSASASINYHLSSSPADHLGLLMKQQQQPLNMHNQILGFQSISQAPPKYTLGNCSKTQQASLEISPGVDSHLKMGVLEELGLSHAHVNNNNNIGVLHQNMVPASSEHGSGNNHNNNNNNVHNSSADWAHRTGTVTDNDGDHDGGFLGSLNGIANYRSDISERVSNGKVVNYSASPSEFRVEKGPECGVAARGEGTVESWINCSSD